MPRFFLITMVLLSLSGCEIDESKPEKSTEPNEIEKVSTKPPSPKTYYNFSVDKPSQQDPQKNFHSINKPLIRGEKIYPQASEDLLKP